MTVTNLSHDECRKEQKAMTTHAIADEEPLAPAALGAGDWLCLAAAPTFAIMALLTGVLGGGPQDMLCAAASPLSGMIPMYPVDERLSCGALAEADLQLAKRCPPVPIRSSPDRTRAARPELITRRDKHLGKQEVNMRHQVVSREDWLKARLDL